MSLILGGLINMKNNQTTSEYYRESKKYWTKKMIDDIKKTDLSALKEHYRDRREAKTIEKIARKNGD